jgi:hypothetical protein
MYRLKLHMRLVLSGKIASPICGMTPPFASLKIGCFVSGSLRRLRRRAGLGAAAGGGAKQKQRFLLCDPYA